MRVKIIVTDGMGNDEEKEINSEKITGKELLAELGISAFEAMSPKQPKITLTSLIMPINMN